MLFTPFRRMKLVHLAPQLGTGSARGVSGPGRGGGLITVYFRGDTLMLLLLLTTSGTGWKIREKCS